MGLFDIFKRKSQNPLEQRMSELAPILFPGGHAQIKQSGTRIAAMLDGRIPADSAGKLYASTKYFSHTASDKSRGRVIEYIVRGGMGIIDAQQAAQIYDEFIADPSTTSDEDVLAAVESAEIVAIMADGEPSGLSIEVQLPASVLRTRITTQAMVTKVVSIINRRVNEGDVADHGLDSYYDRGEVPDYKSRYAELERVVVSSDGTLMFNYNIKKRMAGT